MQIDQHLDVALSRGIKGLSYLCCPCVACQALGSSDDVPTYSRLSKTVI